MARPQHLSQYSGGLTGSHVEKTGMSITRDWSNNTSKLVRAKWKYR